MPKLLLGIVMNKTGIEYSKIMMGWQNVISESRSKSKYLLVGTLKECDWWWPNATMFNVAITKLYGLLTESG